MYRNWYVFPFSLAILSNPFFTVDVPALNLGMIAAYYNISCECHRLAVSQWLIPLLDITVEVYTLSLKEHTKLKGLLEVVSSSAEFETVPIQRHKDALLHRIYDRIPVKLELADFEAPHFETFLLLQPHFSWLQLPPDLAATRSTFLNLLSTLCHLALG